MVKRNKSKRILLTPRDVKGFINKLKNIQRDTDGILQKMGGSKDTTKRSWDNSIATLQLIRCKIRMLRRSFGDPTVSKKRG